MWKLHDKPSIVAGLQEDYIITDWPNHAGMCCIVQCVPCNYTFIYSTERNSHVKLGVVLSIIIICTNIKKKWRANVGMNQWTNYDLIATENSYNQQNVLTNFAPTRIKVSIDNEIMNSRRQSSIITTSMFIIRFI